MKSLKSTAMAAGRLQLEQLPDCCLASSGLRRSMALGQPFEELRAAAE